jgi:predicted small secreted protein
MKRVGLIILLAALGLSACNTMQGMGRDIEKAGEAIQRSAK